MIKEISTIGTQTAAPDAGSRRTAPSDTDFFERLKSAVADVNQAQNDSDKAIEAVIDGKLGVHEGMLRIQEADLSLRMFLQVRAKVMDAYREVMRLQF